MVYWDQCTDEGYLPMTLKEVNRQLEEAGWARTQHFFAETAAALARRVARCNRFAAPARRRRDQLAARARRVAELYRGLDALRLALCREARSADRAPAVARAAYLADRTLLQRQTLGPATPARRRQFF